MMALNRRRVSTVQDTWEKGDISVALENFLSSPVTNHMGHHTHFLLQYPSVVKSFKGP
jgi:hypothetical protein